MVQSMGWIEYVGGGYTPSFIPYGHSYYTYVYNSGNFKQIFSTKNSRKALNYKGLSRFYNVQFGFELATF